MICCWVRTTSGSGPSLLICLSPLDVSDIKYVVNFDFPNNTEDYVHRIGRTARAENTGTAYTYFTTQNAKQARELMNVLKEAKQNINPKLYEMMAIAKQMYQSKSEFVCGAIQVTLICLLQCFRLLTVSSYCHMWVLILYPHTSANNSLLISRSNTKLECYSQTLRMQLPSLFGSEAVPFCL